MKQFGSPWNCLLEVVLLDIQPACWLHWIIWCCWYSSQWRLDFEPDATSHPLLLLDVLFFLKEVSPHQVACQRHPKIKILTHVSCNWHWQYKAWTQSHRTAQSKWKRSGQDSCAEAWHYFDTDKWILEKHAIAASSRIWSLHCRGASAIWGRRNAEQVFWKLITEY